MKFCYTYHVLQRLKERKIEKIWIEETIKFPDITKHHNHKYYAIKKLNGRVLKVVYVKEKHIKIITSHFIK